MKTFKARYTNEGFEIQSNGIAPDDIVLVLGVITLDKIDDFDILNTIVKVSVLLNKKEDAQKIFFKTAHEKIGSVEEDMVFEITPDRELKINGDGNFLNVLFGVMLMEIAFQFDDKLEFLDNFKKALDDLLKIRDEMKEKGEIGTNVEFAVAYLATALEVKQ